MGSATTFSKIVVIGVGNLLLRDDGLGIHAIRRLGERSDCPPEVEIVDGGTLGLDLLHYLEGTAWLLIVDAVDAGKQPGTIVRLEGQQVPAYLQFKMSPHEIGLPDMLLAAKLRDLYPNEVVILGVQPQDVTVGLDLSEPVAASLDGLVEFVVSQLHDWRRRVTSPAHAGCA